MLFDRLTAGTDAKDPKSMHRIAGEETVAIPVLTVFEKRVIVGGIARFLF